MVIERKWKRRMVVKTSWDRERRKMGSEGCGGKKKRMGREEGN